MSHCQGHNGQSRSTWIIHGYASGQFHIATCNSDFNFAPATLIFDIAGAILISSWHVPFQYTQDRILWYKEYYSRFTQLIKKVASNLLPMISYTINHKMGAYENV